ncbi:hypothetical protein CHELA40_14190 [Chelatococcus asaccharovorans]|nr:hypothetical protein CHELA17_61432 [Chelatococcus asaccharovorans]CAH1675803.1 hypothetical protein CHELA40_14190 [Chelatococcus asaccharovorans]
MERPPNRVPGISGLFGPKVRQRVRYVLWTYEFRLALCREKSYVINAVKASERSAVRLAH